jgi:hypothetical protein
LFIFLLKSTADSADEDKESNRYLPYYMPQGLPKKTKATVDSADEDKESNRHLPYYTPQGLPKKTKATVDRADEDKESNRYLPYYICPKVCLRKQKQQWTALMKPGSHEQWRIRFFPSV